jgi:hypothetical protein
MNSKQTAPEVLKTARAKRRKPARFDATASAHLSRGFVRPCACTTTPMKMTACSSPVHAPEAEPLSPETLREHRLLKTALWSHIRNARFLVILSVPLIYACIVPFLLLDLSVSIYQAVCFPVYGIPRVRRKDYLIFDRGRLGYLNAIEKIGCVYCSYANGLLAYIAEIAARTEQHFCPIKHAHPVARPHSRYPKFLPYGEARAYRTRSEQVSRAYADLVTRSRRPS